MGRGSAFAASKEDLGRFTPRPRHVLTPTAPWAPSETGVHQWVAMSWYAITPKQAANIAAGNAFAPRARDALAITVGCNLCRLPYSQVHGLPCAGEQPQPEPPPVPEPLEPEQPGSVPVDPPTPPDVGSGPDGGVSAHRGARPAHERVAPAVNAG